ncbi:hypothetical protein MVEN_01150700 [Mycena venus]|uniref:Uncharacterized protein n=1 Tax=Mycena venus TaxID=2733690 RepID=A0A8H6Y570_9AGAR|nr:hypothetical protein MVEN_01150700 [Mycena venus]
MMCPSARRLPRWKRVSDPKPDGNGNVATRVILPSIFSALTRIANSTDPLKLAINGISYKSFISLFNLTEAAKANLEIASIGNYNSPAARSYATLHPALGKTDVPLSGFVTRLTHGRVVCSL